MVVEQVELSAIWFSEHEPAELDAYFAEQFEHTDRPRDHLAADLGVVAYDHDWLERIECVGHGCSTVGALIRRTGGGEEMADALGDAVWIPARAVVVLHHAEVRDFPRELDGAPHPLHHVANVPVPKELRR
jgi:hypothetical protein